MLLLERAKVVSSNKSAPLILRTTLLGRAELVLLLLGCRWFQRRVARVGPVLVWFSLLIFIGIVATCSINAFLDKKIEDVVSFYGVTMLPKLIAWLWLPRRKKMTDSLYLSRGLGFLVLFTASSLAMVDVEANVAALGVSKKRTFKKFSIRGVDLNALLDINPSAQIPKYPKPLISKLNL